MSMIDELVFRATPVLLAPLEFAWNDDRVRLAENFKRIVSCTAFNSLVEHRSTRLRTNSPTTWVGVGEWTGYRYILLFLFCITNAF